MAEYGDEIIRLIVEMELSPREVCTALTLCHPHAPPRFDAVDDASGKRCPLIGQNGKNFDPETRILRSYTE